jgi:hypothetical protein
VPRGFNSPPQRFFSVFYLLNIGEGGQSLTCPSSGFQMKGPPLPLFFKSIRTPLLPSPFRLSYSFLGRTTIFLIHAGVSTRNKEFAGAQMSTLLTFGVGGSAADPPSSFFQGGGDPPPQFGFERDRIPHLHKRDNTSQSKSAPAVLGGESVLSKGTVFRNNLEPDEVASLLFCCDCDRAGSKKRVEHEIAGITRVGEDLFHQL